MREVRCRDVGQDCDFVARGESDEEVVEACRQHGRSAHGMQSLSKDMERKLRSRIHDA